MMNELRVTRLSVNNGERAFGIDESPCFSWVLESCGQNVLQQSYHVQVFGANYLFDSGEVLSEKCICVEFRELELLPQTQYRVELSVTDNFGNTACKTTEFEMGLMTGFLSDSVFIAPDCENPLNCGIVFNDFNVSKKVARARLYATALGMYTVDLNGERVGDLYFAPFWTSYHKMLEYQTYDITSQVKAGKNSVEMTLAKGWFRSEFGGELKPNIYGNTSAGLAEIHILYEDGTGDIVQTNASWKGRASYITDSEIYHGEAQDFTKDLAATYKVKEVSYDKSVIVSQINEPCRVINRIKPIALITTPEGDSVIDFGQNLVGVAEVMAKGEKGQVVELSHAEVLDKNGNFYTENLRRAKARDTFVLDGNSRVLVPSFTFHGFRYLKVSGVSNIDIDNFTALVVHSDMPESGKIVTSNTLINQLLSNIRWGQKGNFVDVPTDCPQRDERVGWTGDANVFARTSTINFNTAQFFRKWLTDLKNDQKADGSIPAYIPDITNSGISAAMWSDCATMIPYTMYQVYGDERFLRDQFDSMCAYVGKLKAMADKDGLIRKGHQFGDWLALDKEELSEKSGTGATDVFFIADVCHLISTNIVAKSAKILGKSDIATSYEKDYTALLAKIRKEYFTQTGRMVTETQTACTLALVFNIVPEKHRKRLIETFAANLKRHRSRLVTGFIGTPFLCFALTDCGLHDIAQDILMSTGYPGWLYSVKMGATTIWERWNGIYLNGELYEPSMNSFNHYAYGAIGDFIFRRIAGIELLEPGYKKILIGPHFTNGIESITAEYESPYGKIVSGYSIANGKAKIKVTIPVGTTAEIRLPETDKIFIVGSGNYEYEFDTQTNLTGKGFTLDNLISDILEDPQASRIAIKLAPQIFATDAVKMIAPMTFRRVSSYGGEGAEGMYQDVLDMINKEINSL